jgi:AcrR family transcriptional regulator
VARARTRWNGEFDSSTEQHNQKRRLILREAGAAFNEHGFRNVSLDDVGEKLGISKTVCYYYFRDKNHLLLSCVEIGFGLAEGALDVAEALDGSGLDKTVVFMRSYVQGITSDLGTCAVFNELHSLQPSDLQAVRARQRAFGRRLLKLVEAGMADGSIQVGNARSAVGWIVSAPLMIPRLSQMWQTGGTADLAEDYASYTRRSLRIGFSNALFLPHGAPNTALDGPRRV